MKKTITGATLFFLLTSSAALAASAPQAAVSGYDWTGPYAGIELGGGFGQSSRFFTQSGDSTGNFDVDGVLGGVTAGYSWQYGSVVAGLEADFSGSSIGGNGNCPDVGHTCADDLQWLATVRPRLGYAFGNVLPYVTGGLAVGSVHDDAYTNATGAPNDEFTDTEAGWTAGAGVEAALSGPWSVKAEYLYVRLSDADGPSSIGVKTIVPFYANIARVGLNYKF